MGAGPAFPRKAYGSWGASFPSQWVHQGRRCLGEVRVGGLSVLRRVLALSPSVLGTALSVDPGPPSWEVALRHREPPRGVGSCREKRTVG